MYSALELVSVLPQPHHSLIGVGMDVTQGFQAAIVLVLDGSKLIFKGWWKVTGEIIIIIKSVCLYK